MQPNKSYLDVGDLVEDIISGKVGIVLEIKKWSYSISANSSDVYIHWVDGEICWMRSGELIVLSKTDGRYNEIINSKYGVVTSVIAKKKSNEEKEQ